MFEALGLGRNLVERMWTCLLVRPLLWRRGGQGCGGDAYLHCTGFSVYFEYMFRIGSEESWHWRNCTIYYYNKVNILNKCNSISTNCIRHIVVFFLTIIKIILESKHIFICQVKWSFISFRFIICCKVFLVGIGILS